MIRARHLLHVALASSLLVSPALAGSPSDPEIGDDEGDVNVQHMVDAGVLDEEAPRDELATAGDVTKAWIDKDKETRDSFTVVVEVADIPDDENVSSPLVDVWSHFTVREGDYHVKASLTKPSSGEPMEASYELYLDETAVGELTGSVDAEADRLSVRVPKADVRDPGGDDELSSFYVTTHAPDSGVTLDYAPGAKQDNVVEEDATASDPTSLSLAPSPSYGDRYAFQDMEETASQITVDVTPESLEIEAGQQESFAVRVVNDAEEADEASLSVSNTPPGWSARLDPGSMTVPAKGSQTATLHVTPADDAEGHELMDLNVVTSLGADKGASVSVIAVQSGDASAEEPDAEQSPAQDEAEDTGDEPAPAAGDDPEQSSAKEEADAIPTPSVVAVLAGLAAVATLLRRRG
ncbi:hypothetical protein BRD56_05790 [Thermoplasmatales archaeon SW_10_69_26]|nr:MAG: hypothetical protein BRD56_05790 [Thermoplasmatales archaeon SW_10_69_26]